MSAQFPQTPLPGLDTNSNPKISGFILINTQGIVEGTDLQSIDLEVFGDHDFYGKPFVSFLSNLAGTGEHDKYLQQQINNGSPFELSITVSKTKKKSYSISFSGKPVNGLKKNVHSYIVHYTKIPAPRKGKKDETVTGVDWFADNGIINFFKKLPLGLLITNESGKVVYVNNQFISLFHLVSHQAQLTGMCEQDMFNLLSKSFLRKDISLIRKPLSKRLKKTQEPLKFRLKDGSTISCDCLPVNIDKGYKGQLWWFEKIALEEYDAEFVSGLQRLMTITNEAAKIGSWEYNCETNELFWSPTTKKIHEVADDFIPDVTTGINFYKPGSSREMIASSVEKCIATGAPFELDLELITATGRNIWVRAIGSPQLIDGKISKIYGSFQDITENKLLQKDLEINYEKYKSLFKYNPLAVFQTDYRGAFVNMNAEALKTFALTEAQIQNHIFENFVSPEYKHTANEEFAGAHRGEKRAFFLRLKNLKGKEFFVELTTVPIISQNEIVGIYGIIKDLTHEQTILSKLKDSEERFKLAVETASDGIWDWLIDQNLVYLTASFKKLINYPENENYVSGSEVVAKLLYPDDHVIFWNSYIQHVKNKKPFAIECRLRTNGNGYKWFLLKGQAVWDEKGHAYRMAGSFKDIHIQRQLADDLKESNNLFTRAVNESNDYLREVDLTDPKKSFISDRLFTSLGYNITNIKGNAADFYESLIHPEDIKTRDELRTSHLKGETSFYESEFRLRLQNGTYRWHKSRAKATYDKNGAPIRLTGSISDIDIEKKLQKSLLESNTLYELAIKGSSDSIWDYHFLTGESKISERASEVLGFTRQQLEIKDFFDSLVHPDDDAARRQEWYAHLDHKKPFYRASFRVRNKNGQYRWFLSRGQAEFNQNGEPVRITGSLTDIHDQKMMEQQLTEMNQTLLKQQENLERVLNIQTATLNALPDKIIKINRKGSINFLHLAPQNILFKKRKPLIGQNLFELNELEEALRNFIKENINVTQVVTKEFEFLLGRDLYYFDVRLSPAKDSELLIIIRNITQQKKAENDLVKKEEKYRNLIENMNIGLLEVDNNGVITDAFPKFCEMIGYNQQELIGRRAEEFLSVNPDSNLEQERILKRQSGYSELYENVLNKKGGEKINVLVSGTPLVNNMGIVMGSVGIHYDITSQKKTEQLLNEAKELGKIGFFEIDLVTGIINWDKTTKRIFEVADSFVPTLENGIEFYKEGENRRRITQAVNDAVEKGKTLIDDFEVISAMGRLKWVKVIARVEKINGTPVKIAGITIDISELKESERKIQEYLTFNQTILSSIKDGFYVLNGQMQFIYVNETAAVYFKNKSQEILGKDYFDMIPVSSTRNALNKVIEAVCTSQQSKTIVIKESTGSKDKWWEFNIYPSYQNGVSVLFKDKTVEKEQEERVKLLNNKYKAITKATNQIVFDWDFITDYVELNDAYDSLIGYTDKGSRTGDFNFKLIHPEDAVRIKDSISDTIAAKRHFWQGEQRIRNIEGVYRYFYTRGVLIYDADKQAIRMMGTVEDITDRIKLNEQLVKAKVNAQRKISEAVINAQEQERDFIGHELHDNVNQILSAAILYLELAETQSFTNNETVSEIKKLINKAIDELRLLSRRLTPPSLKDIGLAITIRDLIQLVAKASTINFKYEVVSPLQKELTEARSLILYRISQELLNNVIKYSKAKNCTVYLASDDGNSVSLRVEDDGVGFDPQKIKKGLGLRSTVARVELHGGSFDISSSPGKGSAVFVQIPYK